MSQGLFRYCHVVKAASSRYLDMRLLIRLHQIGKRLQIGILRVGAFKLAKKAIYNSYRRGRLRVIANVGQRERPHQGRVFIDVEARWRPP